MVDGDDTYPIEMATEMTRLLQTHDVVVGSRLKGTIEPGAMTRLNVVGNTLSRSSRGCYLVCISATCARVSGAIEATRFGAWSSQPAALKLKPICSLNA